MFGRTGRKKVNLDLTDANDYTIAALIAYIDQEMGDADINQAISMLDQKIDARRAERSPVKQLAALLLFPINWAGRALISLTDRAVNSSVSLENIFNRGVQAPNPDDGELMVSMEMDDTTIKGMLYTVEGFGIFKRLMTLTFLTGGNPPNNLEFQFNIPEKQQRYIITIQKFFGFSPGQMTGMCKEVVLHYARKEVIALHNDPNTDINNTPALDLVNRLDWQLTQAEDEQE